MPTRRPRNSAADRVSGLALGDAELELLQGSPKQPAVPESTPAASRPPVESPRPAPTPRAPARSQRTRGAIAAAAGIERIRAEVYLPDEVVAHAKALVRPSRTGARRTLSVAFALQAYICAIDQLNLSIDFNGLDRDDGDQAVRRVLHALETWKDRQA